ncbi:uncharacterized protein LOC126979555 [Leptidea sinapis]|uniref:uncharacterized protein LOC126979555 n=1 Tax=Leptidea sinapis TaxID=189913 RepID=UPI00213521B4|nr:uncharacterized protein LOC126979555 [Leptidea sinapis]
MTLVWLYICSVVILFRCSNGIRGGIEVSTAKGYVVYLVMAKDSDQKYIGWTCGGAIVSKWHILTSAACVTDVVYMYAIAGYDTYVPTDELDKDKCTRNTRKKIVHLYSHRDYKFRYKEMTQWAMIDIALARVESHYIFDDEVYTTYCSYKPTIIPINYDSKYQGPTTDVIIFGWGHRRYWREEGDTTDYNQKKLHYASTKIYPQELCKEFYEPDMHSAIERYMFCTHGRGKLDETGNHINGTTNKLIDGCSTVLQNGEIRWQCIGVQEKETLDNWMKINNTTSVKYKKVGICQNDHGGPVVAWVGSREVVIGVASGFRVSSQLKCIGPCLMTSTFCSGYFLDCILSSTRIVQGIKNAEGKCVARPFDDVGGDITILERTISWYNHSDGPADNE